MKQKLLKNFLVAFALVTGSMGVKAAEIDYNVELINQNYSDVTNESDNWTAGVGTALAQTLRAGTDYYYTISYTGTSSKFSTNYNLPDLSSYSAYKLSFLWGMYSCSANNRSSLFSVVGSSSDVITTGSVVGQSSSTTINGIELLINKYDKSDRGYANRIKTMSGRKIVLSSISDC